MGGEGRLGGRAGGTEDGCSRPAVSGAPTRPYRSRAAVTTKDESSAGGRSSLSQRSLSQRSPSCGGVFFLGGWGFFFAGPARCEPWAGVVVVTGARREATRGGGNQMGGRSGDWVGALEERRTASGRSLQRGHPALWIQSE
jgi:hypothetical protein